MSTPSASMYGVCYCTVDLEIYVSQKFRVKLFRVKFSWFQGTHDNILTGELWHVYNMAYECEKAYCIRRYHVYLGTYIVYSRTSLVKYSSAKESHGTPKTAMLLQWRRTEQLSDIYRERCRVFARSSWGEKAEFAAQWLGGEATRVGAKCEVLLIWP